MQSRPTYSLSKSSISRDQAFLFVHIPDILRLHGKLCRWEIEETMGGRTCSISSLRMRWKLSWLSGIGDGWVSTLSLVTTSRLEISARQDGQTGCLYEVGHMETPPLLTCRGTTKPWLSLVSWKKKNNNIWGIWPHSVLLNLLFNLFF